MALAELLVETFQRTDAAGSRRGARVRWLPATPDTEVVVRWQHRADPAPWGDWAQTDVLRAGAFEIFPALPGRYAFAVFDQAPGRRILEHPVLELEVPTLLESELELPKPSGVELVGPAGELLGSAREFVGRDLRVRWNAVRLDALETDGLGEAPEDELLDLLEIRVLADGELQRTVLLPVHASEWTYTYAMSTEDQPLALDPASAVRDVRLELRWKDRLGRLGPPAVLEVEHTLQLSATADIETSAVTALTEVVDATPNDDGAAASPFTYILLDEVEVIGGGYPIACRFTDRWEWTGVWWTFLYTFLSCRLRIIDPSDVTIAEAEHRCIEWWGQTANSADVYSHPDVTVRAELEEGVEYRIQAHLYWHHEPGALDAMGATSLDRRFQITDLKR